MISSSLTLHQSESILHLRGNTKVEHNSLSFKLRDNFSYCSSFGTNRVETPGHVIEMDDAVFRAF